MLHVYIHKQIRESTTLTLSLTQKTGTTSQAAINNPRSGYNCKVVFIVAALVFVVKIAWSLVQISDSILQVCMHLHHSFYTSTCRSMYMYNDYNHIVQINHDMTQLANPMDLINSRRELRRTLSAASTGQTTVENHLWSICNRPLWMHLINNYEIKSYSYYSITYQEVMHQI